MKDSIRRRLEKTVERFEEVGALLADPEVIGKQGKTAKAIRTILSAASAKVHKRAVLEIIE